MNIIMLCKIRNIKSNVVFYSANPDVAQEFTGKDYILYCKTVADIPRITGRNIYKTDSLRGD